MAEEARRLIHNAGGVPISAPTMKEVPLEANDQAFVFAEELLAGRVNIVIFMTGVGTRYLFAALQTRYEQADLVRALSATTTVARGPKPVRVLRELGVPVTITVPEPNTWRQILAALDEATEGVEVEGATVAVQEYGVSNDEFVAALRARGAAVHQVPVYRWELPDDIHPLQDAIGQVLARTVDVLLFTSSNQLYSLLEVVRRLGKEQEFRAALRELVVCSVGPVCTETLVEHGFHVDMQPSHPKIGTLIKEAGEQAPAIVADKRATLRAAAAPARPPRPAADPRLLSESPFMKACRGEPVPYTPVWLMRQAGRYMQEYREVRARYSFLDLCKMPELAAKVTVEAQERIGADAAILFSDILLILEPMGLGLEYVHGDGPSLSRLVRGPEDVDRLREIDPRQELAFVYDAIARIRAELQPNIPLIGFSGAPFTLASYVIEGGGSKNYVATKRFMYTDAGAWNAMMSVLSRAVARYLSAQAEAGCQALQIFDSWVGCLSPYDYETYVLPHMRAIMEALPKDVPVIHFGTDTATLLDLQMEAGARVLGVDHRMDIGQAFDRFPGTPIQGNLDPVILLSDVATVKKQAARVLEEVGGRPGHIFNLGHGILPGTPVDNVIALVDTVHELSSRS
ncbi:MAG TPA: uroporphyrinogen decarboxylase [Candidatus Limnocylindrales bacterium]|nr:uroporphyrinogen decarboxylase [Candidatus Limnocylindrales bacterium]